MLKVFSSLVFRDLGDNQDLRRIAPAIPATTEASEPIDIGSEITIVIIKNLSPSQYIEAKLIQSTRTAQIDEKALGSTCGTSGQSDDLEMFPSAR